MADDLASDGGATLSPEDFDIVAGVESAITGAVELEAWWSAVDAADAYDERFDLATTHNRPDEGFGFFGEAQIGGAAVPVMGHVRQQLFDRPKMAGGTPGTGLPEAHRQAAAWMNRQVREFVLRYLLRVSGFQQPDAFPGKNGQAPPPAYLKPFSWYPDGEEAEVGFGFQQVYFKRPGDDEPRKFSGKDRHAVVDLRQIGKTYEWVVLEVDLFDFGFVFAPFGESLPHGRLPGTEPSYLVLSDAFIVDDEEPGDAGELGRYGFGYAFLPAREESILAYGLGQFDAAFQTVCFHVREDGEVTARLAFAANRPRQVVKLQVDPVDWGLRLADRFSFGTATSVIEPMQKMWQRMPGAGGVDPVQAFITAANVITSGGAARNLGVSRKQLHKNFLVAQFKQHYNVVAGSLATWRQIPDWLDRQSLPEWVVSGKSVSSPPAEE